MLRNASSQQVIIFLCANHYTLMQAIMVMMTCRKSGEFRRPFMVAGLTGESFSGEPRYTVRLIA